MNTARDVMTKGCECLDENDTVVQAARRMKERDVGWLPVCGDDERLQGVVTDRDIVVRCIAEGMDPSSTTVGTLAEGKPVTIGADSTIEETIRTMRNHGVRRLPVIDGHTLVGVVAQADIARHAPDAEVGDLVEAISRAPANN
jgi:CBS domain-containing protein